MRDFLTFKRMITPVIIQILFWLGAAVSAVVGLVLIVRGLGAHYGGGAMVFGGILWILLGPLAARIYCEILIVLFSMNDTLMEIRNLLRNKSSP